MRSTIAVTLALLVFTYSQTAGAEGSVDDSPKRVLDEFNQRQIY